MLLNAAVDPSGMSASSIEKSRVNRTALMGRAVRLVSYGYYQHVSSIVIAPSLGMTDLYNMSM